MSISKMKKLLVIAHTDSADRIVKKLISLRCVDVRELSDCDGAKLLEKKGYSEQIDVANKKLQMAESVRAALLKLAPKKRGANKIGTHIDREEFISSGAYAETGDVIELVYEKLQEADSDISEYVPYIEKIESFYDIEMTVLTGLEIKQKALYSESCVFISGWMPQKSQGSVERALSEDLCAFEITEPTKDDLPPVSLTDNFITKCFSWITKDYGLPSYSFFDPTLLMSIFCFIAFGLMLCDVGYGLILIPLGFILPAAIGMRGKMRSLFNMLGICGISSVIFGILFGGWFGDMPYTIMREMLWERSPEIIAPLFEGVLPRPVQKPLIYLAIVLSFGALQIIVGMLIKLICLCKEGKAKDALLDIVPWWIIFAGIALAFTVNIFVGIAIVVVGALIILIFAGRKEKSFGKRLLRGLLGLCKLGKYVLNLAGYLKLFVIGITLGAVSHYINVLATIVGPTTGGYVLLVLVGIVCHGIFFALNVYVGSIIVKKIQHHEFFSQFYVRGGEGFTPVCPEEKYTSCGVKK